MSKKATIKNMLVVIQKIATAYEKSDDSEKEVWVESFNEMLDSLHDDDFFGTEGQSDPRGDNRD